MTLIKDIKTAADVKKHKAELDARVEAVDNPADALRLTLDLFAEAVNVKPTI